jgi:hypothetical protein
MTLEKMRAIVQLHQLSITFDTVCAVSDDLALVRLRVSESVVLSQTFV